jgi:signal transduction histidine kinase
MGLIGIILLIGLGIGFLAMKLQRQSMELRAQLKQIDSESFRIADQFAEFLRQLNDSLYHYGRSDIPADANGFNKASHELDLWIEAQQTRLTTEQEKAIMRQIDSAYDEYLQAAKELLTRLQALGNVSVTMDEYTDMRRRSQRLFQLVQTLSRAHLASRDQIWTRTSTVITQLQLLVLVSLGLVFAFALGLGVVVYRDMILPLRLKLVQSEVLRERQEKLASLGVLAAGVAHEIRNPLTAIKAVLFIQQKRFPRASLDYSDSKIVEREILRLEQIVNDFLSFARPGDFKPRPINADAQLREVAALLAPQLALRGVQLLLPEASSLPVYADPQKIKQVLINLIQNAGEAITDQGVIKLRAETARRRLGPKVVDVVVIEIEDNGKGIPPEVQKRLFDPFYTTKDTGTGLGLSIAARIVQSHGGILEYQSTPGVGTTFGVILPAATGAGA